MPFSQSQARGTKWKRQKRQIPQREHKGERTSKIPSGASLFLLPAVITSLQKVKKPRAPFLLIQKPAVRTAKLCHLGDKGTRKVYPGWALQWPGSLLFLFSSSGQPRREGEMKLQVSDANLARGQLSLDVG